ncbi:hypothetical protein [Aromatoleum petrolei]|uniref:Uncharacterized protein n=1 Tax=Aromatoleum petrolei TaxID=76116 RepID=A0ABX1MS17_9RHOO|nr:hypothetical protein [Aromatoleum petrolei]NMF90725.1 hypothetical protein [Aromatoleum petrolei]QTQ38390.1 Uncharacterized protein ToN1_42910 [Aromatoleum petrolei]
MTDPISSTNPTADTLLNDTPLDVAGAARELGLKPVRAWVPDEKKKASTAGAERVRRCRAKAEQQGFKQLSITVSAELHPMLKTLAARTKAGEPAEAVLAELLPESSISPSVTADKHPESSVAWLDALPAWRRWLLRWLLPRGVASTR